MTDAEYISLMHELFAYTPNSDPPYQKQFVNVVKKDKKALAEAKALFPTGDALYFASNSALSAFAIMYNYGLTTQKKNELGSKVQKMIKARKR